MSLSSTSPSTPPAPSSPAARRFWTFGSTFRLHSVWPRRGAPEQTPALLCVALLVGLVMQFAFAVGTPLPPDSGLAPRRAKPVVVLPVPGYPALLADDVFAPDRTPRSELGGAGTAAAGVASPLAAYALLGVTMSGRGTVALVKGPDGHALSVRPGSEVGGWRLAGLNRDRASFVRNGEHATLVVGAKPAAASPPAAAPAPDAAQ